MAQLHFYVPDDVARQIQQRAVQANMSVSRYLAELVKREASDQWPKDYFDQVFGQWEGEPLQRAPQGELEKRVELE